MTFLDFLAWTTTIAGLITAVCSVLLAFRPQLPPLLRFGPLFVTLAYFAAALTHYAVQGVASLILIPLGGFALFLGGKLLSRRLVLAYLFAGSTFLFWPVAIFVFSRYLILVHFAR